MCTIIIIIIVIVIMVCSGHSALCTHTIYKYQNNFFYVCQVCFYSIGRVWAKVNLIIVWRTIYGIYNTNTVHIFIKLVAAGSTSTSIGRWFEHTHTQTQTYIRNSDNNTDNILWNVFQIIQLIVWNALLNNTVTILLNDIKCSNLGIPVLLARRQMRI